MNLAVRPSTRFAKPRSIAASTHATHATRSTRLALAACAVLATLAAPAARAAEVAYISSSSGYVLGGNGTASTAAWSGQPPMHGFAGYGAIQANGKCLTGRTGGQPLTWEACKGDTAQKWSLANRRLNNELGWCADVQGNRGGAGVPVLAFKCSGAINQQWNSHMLYAVPTVVAAISNPVIRSKFSTTVATAPIGGAISAQTGNLIGNDGGSLAASNQAFVKSAQGLISQDGGGLMGK